MEFSGAFGVLVLDGSDLFVAELKVFCLFGVEAVVVKEELCVG